MDNSKFIKKDITLIISVTLIFIAFCVIMLYVNKNNAFLDKTAANFYQFLMHY